MKQRYRAWNKTEKNMIAWEKIKSEFTFEHFDDENLELMLSTGIEDKAGNEIFEGDILITNAHASIVSFGKYTYFEDADTEATEVGFYLSYLNVSPATYSPFEEFLWEKCQIIGNIHENDLQMMEDIDASFAEDKKETERTIQTPRERLVRTLIGLLRRWSMRIKTSNDSIINVDSVKRSVTIEGVEFGSDCSALVSKNKDGTGTITLIFEGKII